MEGHGIDAQGHYRQVQELAFAPDGAILASGDTYGNIKLWDLRADGEIAPVEVRAGIVLCAVFSPDGKTLATSAGRGPVKLWDLDTGSERLRLGGFHHLEGRNSGFSRPSLEFSPDGQFLACGGGVSGTPEVKFYDTATGEEVHVLEGVRHVAFSPDGSTIMASAHEPDVPGSGFWDVSTWERVSPVEDVEDIVVYDAEGKAVGDYHPWFPGQVSISRTGSASLREAFALGDTSFAADMSRDGQTLRLVCEDNTVRLWDVSGKKPKATPDKLVSNERTLAFSPDGKVLASAAANGGVILRELLTGRELGRLAGHTSVVRSIAFSPDGATLAFAGGYEIDSPPSRHRFPGRGQWGYGWVELWDVRSQSHRATLGACYDWPLEEVALTPVPGVGSVTFSPDGKQLALACRDGRIRFWDTGTLAERAMLAAHSEIATFVAFSGDGSTLITVGVDNVGDSHPTRVKAWDSHTHTSRALLPEAYVKWGSAATVSPDGRFLAYQMQEESGPVLCCWDLNARRLLWKEKVGYWTSALAFSPDGKTMAISCKWLDVFSFKDTVRNGSFFQLRNAATGMLLAEQELAVDDAFSVTCHALAFSPDGRTLASGDRKLRLWDPLTGDLRAVLGEHLGNTRPYRRTSRSPIQNSAIQCVAFSPDGRTLVSAAHNGTLIFRDAYWPARDQRAPDDD